MTNSTLDHRDLDILERIAQEPDASQASIADQLGVAVGTINWHLKRLVAKGYVKVQRAERRKLRYIITPEGLALRARLTLNYIHTSFELYRLVRQRMLSALEKVQEAGHSQIRLVGESGDVIDVCRLTCLEKGINVVQEENAPLIRLQGLKLFLELDSRSSKSGSDFIKKGKLTSNQDL